MIAERADGNGDDSGGEEGETMCSILTCNEAPKVQMPRWNATISHTQQQIIIPFCTAITMQYNSYAIRSQSVLSTIELGVSTMSSNVSTAVAY